MSEQIIIDEKYLYEFNNGEVQILRNGKPWLSTDDSTLTGPNAWIAAANVIEDLRKRNKELENKLSTLETNEIIDESELNILHDNMSWYVDIQFNADFFKTLLYENPELAASIDKWGASDTLNREKFLDEVVDYLVPSEKWPENRDHKTQEDLDALKTKMQQAYNEWEAKNF